MADNLSLPRDLAIVAFAQAPSIASEHRTEAQMLVPLLNAVLEQSGIDRRDIGFTVSGSCDYLTGATFTFVQMLEATAAWPPISESHVEADGAWALYEGWVRLLHGDIDSVMVYASGKSSLGNQQEVMSMWLDPYYLETIGLDMWSYAGLQAQAVLEAGLGTERDWAAIAALRRGAAAGNPYAQVHGDADVDALLAEPYVRGPLRPHACPPVSDAAAAMIITTAERARRITDRPVYIRGIDHRSDAHYLGVRDLSASASTRLAGEKAAARAGFRPADVDVAELHALYPHEEQILRRELGLDDGGGTGDGGRVVINPSGGALCANPVMVAGLIRVGEAYEAVRDGRADRALAHAQSGPCLQQNLVCLLEGGE
jgi:acetyl-CoA acetyltransferase